MFFLPFFLSFDFNWPFCTDQQSIRVSWYRICLHQAYIYFSFLQVHDLYYVPVKLWRTPEECQVICPRPTLTKLMINPLSLIFNAFCEVVSFRLRFSWHNSIVRVTELWNVRSKSFYWYCTCESTKIPESPWQYRLHCFAQIGCSCNRYASFINEISTSNA